MTRPEKTSARVARIAAKVLAMKNRGDLRLYHHPNDKAEETDLYWRDIRALAASALTQAEDKRPSGPATIKGKRPSSWPSQRVRTTP